MTEKSKNPAPAYAPSFISPEAEFLARATDAQKKIIRDAGHGVPHLTQDQFEKAMQPKPQSLQTHGSRFVQELPGRLRLVEMRC